MDPLAEGAATRKRLRAGVRALLSGAPACVPSRRAALADIEGACRDPALASVGADTARALLSVVVEKALATPTSAVVSAVAKVRSQKRTLRSIPTSLPARWQRVS